MVKTERIIKVLDEELVLQNKSFFTLQQANEILLKKGIFQESDITNKTLKHLLEGRAITNANQTSHPPKQWRIIHSGGNQKSKQSSDPKIDLEKKQESLINKDGKQIDCPACGNPIEVTESLKSKTFLKCLKCGNIFHNPLSKNILLSAPVEAKIKYLFEAHGLKIIIGIAVIVIISIIVIKSNSSIDRGGNTRIISDEDRRIERIKQFVSDILHENESNCADNWAVIASLKAADDSYHGNINVHCNMYPDDLLNCGILINTSKFFVPYPSENAKKDSVYGLPVSFFYKFYFDVNDSLTSKYLVVVYDSDSTVKYDFKTRLLNKLIDVRLAKRKIEKWQKDREQLAAKQKKEISDKNQCQPSVELSECQKEKKYISDVYNMLMNNIKNLERQYQVLGYEDLAGYIGSWNRNAAKIRQEYHIDEFNCFFAFDYNRMLSSYQQA